MDQIIPAPAPTRTEMGDLSSLTTTQKGSIVGAINEVDADVGTLNSKLTPTDYTTTGLTGNNCTFDRGGYCRIGNLVIVNIRVNISGSGANVTGFPAPKNIIGFGGYDGNSDKSAFGYMNTSGSLVIPTAYGNSGAVMFSFAYIT